MVTIGGDDTNGAAKKMYETYGIPVIGFPKTIDNDLRTRTYHHYQGQQFETVLCPGFPSGAMAVKKLTSKLHTTNESHQRIMVLEVMGRDAGWLTGSASFGGAQMALVPEVEMTKERKEFFFESVNTCVPRNTASLSLFLRVFVGGTTRSRNSAWCMPAPTSTNMVTRVSVA